MQANKATLNNDTPANLQLLQNLVHADLMRVNHAMSDALRGDIPLIQRLSNHIIAAGGKRLRPSLTLASAHLFNYEGDRHIALAACVEFIHTATLLHDDVVDESTLRRGEATANALFGNKASVLVGDFLLSRAFQMMVEDGSLKVLKILSDAASIISKGEVKQLIVSHNPRASEAEYLDVIGSKTAALFAAACELGAVVSKREQEEEKLRAYGYNLGVAFQLIDDALDYIASQEKLGKTIGDDFRDGKITLPIILAYAKGDDAEKNFWHKTLEDHEQSSDDFDHALTLMNKYGTIKETIERARNYGFSALDSIKHLPHSTAKQALIDTVAFCIDREY